MEKDENKDDVIYDLERSEGSEGSEMSEGSEGSKMSEESEGSEMSERSEGSEMSERSEGSEASGDVDPAMAEIERMVGEMGAETLLEIIRDNRNAAIRQIISEVEAARERDMPSGFSGSMGCSSIFDLAALA